jgi:heme oxygenase
MTNDQILEMAKQTDMPHWYGTDDPVFVKELIAFARLIEAAIKKEIRQTNLTETQMEQIMDEANVSFRKHFNRTRGQQLTMWDNRDAHIAAAAIRKGGAA